MTKKYWEDTLKTENLSDKEREKIYIEFSKGSYWMSRALSQDNAEAQDAVNWGARMIVDYIMNLQLKKIIAYSDKYKIQQTVLCVGETLAQYAAKRTQEVLAQDLKEMLTGITKEDARKIGLRVAYEPRWAIGTGKTPVSQEIQTTHRFIKDTLKGILGTELEADYGGSLSEKNCAEFLALPDVDGGLIGGAAKTPAAISPVIDEAIKQGERKGKLLNIGMNWKAEDAKSGLSPVDAFVELFRTKDLSKVRIAIGTPNVKLVRDIMTKLEDEISAVSLYSGIVVKTENIGPFIKETLAAKSQNTEVIYVELEKRFVEKTREGDVYFRLKLRNRYFALVKENAKDATLMTVTTLDLKDTKTKAEYYDALLDYVSLVALQANKGIELIEEKGDRLKQFMASTLLSFDKSLSMTFKESPRPVARGWSLIVAPVVTPAPTVTQKVVEAEELYNTIPWLVTFKGPDLEGKRVVSRVDWNLPNLRSIIRIKASIPGILYVLKNGGTPVIATHYGRPGGKVDLKYSVKALADILKGLLAEQGEVYPVNFLEGSVTEKGLQEGLKAKIIPGAINILENTRFCPGDEKNDPAFAKALAALGDIFNFAGFGAGERVHASTAGLAEYIDQIVLDPLTVKEEQTIRALLKTLYGVIFGGGPKVSEKIGTLRSIVNNIQEGGYVIIGTGPLPAFLKAMYNIEIGQKAEDADIAAAKEIIGLAENRNVKILLPADFVAVKFAGKDISEQRVAAEAMLKSKKIPAGAKIYTVTLEQLKQGAFVNNNIGEKISSQDIFVYDLGPVSIAEFKQVMRNTPKDYAIFWNGTVGVNEIAEFEAGTKEIAVTLGEVSKNDTRPEGVNGVTGGGDTAAAAEQFGVDRQLTFVSTGGGASLALLEGKELTAIMKLAEIQAANTAKKLNVEVNGYRGFIDVDKAIYRAIAGDAFSAYINELRDILQTAKSKENTRALIIAPGFFKIGGATTALKEMVKLSMVKVALYGENSEKMKILIGNNDIITGKTPDELLTELSNLGILAEHTLLLRAPEDKLDKELKIRQVVAREMSTLALAKANRELLSGSDFVEAAPIQVAIGYAFSKFFTGMLDSNVISKEVYTKVASQVVARLQREELFEFPGELALEATKKIEAAVTEAERQKYEEFLTKIGV